MVGPLRPRLRATAALLLLASAAAAADFSVYVGNIAARQVLLAWGKTEGGGNTIGRDSKSYGPAVVSMGGKIVETEHNWATVDGLEPDTEYRYRITVRNQVIGEDRVRTWPERTDRMAFFVLGDYGNGSSGQLRIAEAMWQTFEKQMGTNNPVRFVLTTGDNIYADVRLGAIILRSGDEDRHWRPKFFGPYEKLIRRIPFYPTLGNHDGNASEHRDDLTVYLDNFFFPAGKAARWYSFSFGGLADFFALDSTDNLSAGERQVAYANGGAQYRWFQGALQASAAPWKIAYFHHPPFTAGPEHRTSYHELEHFVRLFVSGNVRVVFNGHEHNFQISTQDPATDNILYVISGAGGALRPGDVTAQMERAHIAGWAPQRHFLLVQIEGTKMSIMPISYEPMRVRNSEGQELPLPFTLTLPAR